MRWILLDAVLGLLFLVALAVVLLRVWKTVKALGKQVADTGELVTRATTEIAARQTRIPMGAGTAYASRDDLGGT